MKRLVLPWSLLPIRLAALLCFLAGATYFLRSTPMPYHLRYLGTPFADLPEHTRGLILALLHATGCGLLSIGLGLGYLAWTLLPTGNPHARTAALLIITCATATMTWVTLNVGLYTPWWVILLMGISSVVGLLLHGKKIWLSN